MPGRIEQNVHIFDLKDVGLYDVPLATVGYILRQSIGSYPMSMHSSAVVNLGLLLRISVNLIMPFLDEFLKLKTFFEGPDFVDTFEERIGLKNLEEKFGG